MNKMLKNLLAQYNTTEEIYDLDTPLQDKEEK